MAEPNTLLSELVRRAAWIPPGLFWAVAVLVGLACALKLARARGLDESEVYWLGLSAIAGGLVGGHLLGLYVYRDFHAAPEAWWQVWDGGKCFYGGLAGATLASSLYVGARGLPVLKYADVLAPATALGYAVGRWACFFNGDDFGTPTTGWFSVTYGTDTEAFFTQMLAKRVLTSESYSLAVHPVQLYASLLGLLIFLALRRERRTGEAVASFLLLYGGGRFLLEHFRGDFTPFWGPLSLHQVLSLGMLAAGSSLLLHLRLKGLKGAAHDVAALRSLPSET